ncbi:YkgJ family cysteine cluster protein [Myxococcaceae bacterium GXIMD 01537]
MPLSTLCQRCGLCCDGSLFTQVPLQPAEAAALRRLDLPVGQRDDGAPVLAQHCPALEGRSCTVYADRPAPCRAYRCHLHLALGEGEVSLEEALAVIDGAHAHIREVEAALPAWSSDQPRAVMQRARRSTQPAVSEPLARAEAYLDRHLRGRARRA